MVYYSRLAIFNEIVHDRSCNTNWLLFVGKSMLAPTVILVNLPHLS